MGRKNNDVENDIDLQEILQEKLNALKKNREKIPEIDLNGKYKKAYNALLKTIDDLAKELMEEIIFHFLVNRQFLEEGLKLSVTLIKRNRKRLLKALYSSYSAREYADICENIHQKLVNCYFKRWQPSQEELLFTLNPWNPKVFYIQDSGKCKR